MAAALLAALLSLAPLRAARAAESVPLPFPGGHGGGPSGTPVPFSPPDGLTLEGRSFPNSGAYNEHASSTAIVSSNGVGSGDQESDSPPAEQPRRGRQRAQPTPEPTPAPVE